MAVYDFFGKAMPLTVWSSNKITAGSGASTLFGTSGDDDLVPNGAGTISGGLGNDTYESVYTGTKVIEAAGGGIDTVYVNSNYVMPDNVENLVIWWAPAVFGNSLGNYMKGTSAVEQIDGAQGNDYLVGGGGRDTFQFSAASGYDVVADFGTSGQDADIVRLAGYSQFKSFSQVKAAMTQVGGDVVMQLDADNAIKFLNHNIADFSADNFRMGLDTSALKLTFADEFDSLSLWNGESGASSSGTWRTDYGWGATRDSLASRQLASEKQVFIDPKMKGAGSSPIGISPFTLADGKVTITARPTPEHLRGQLYNQSYISGMLTSRPSFAQTYGYFEARIDIPSGSGLWPIFWLGPADGSWPPEIDIMENFGGGDTTFTAHSGTRAAHVEAMGRHWDPKIAEGFHTWGLMWTEEKLSWYLDGVEVYSTATPAGMNKPMYVLLDVAVQKNAPDGMTGEMVIDYVRAYSLDGSPSQPPATPTPPPVTTPLPPTSPTPPAATIIGVAADGSKYATSSVDYALAGDVRDLTLTQNATRGTGNSLNNIITGNAADNILLGLGGNDVINGGAGSDKIDGGDGNDTLHGGDGADILTGGAGNDLLDGGTGADQMTGGGGADIYHVDNVGDTVTELAGGGQDKVFASVDFTMSNYVEDLEYVGSGSWKAQGNIMGNIITGGSGGDTIDAGAGNDQLYGRAGDDILMGGSGIDTLVGGSGADILTGGSGADTFVFQDLSDFAPGSLVDRITDFSMKQNDMIDLSGIDAVSGTAANDAFSWIGQAQFSGRAGELRYASSGKDIVVMGDINGNGTADFSLLLNNVSSLASSHLKL